MVRIGSYDNVDLKALNLKSLDRGVIITKIEKGAIAKLKFQS